MIDVNPLDQPQKSGCLGCLGKLIPISIIGLLVFTAVAWLAYGVWYAKDPKKAAELEAAKKAAEAAAKGESATAGNASGGKEGNGAATSAGDNGATADSAGSAGSTAGGAMQAAIDNPEAAKAMIAAYEDELAAAGKTPEERTRLIQEKFGHLAEQPIAPSEVAGGTAMPEGIKKEPAPVKKTIAVDGGSSSNVEVSQGVGQSRDYMKARGTLQAVGSDLVYEMIYQESGEQLHFRFFLMPYEPQTDKLFKKGESYLTLRFADTSGQPIIPAEDAQKLPLGEMVAYEQDGKPAGWVIRGIMPLDGADSSAIASARVGWKLTPELGGWLKELRKIRGN